MPSSTFNLATASIHPSKKQKMSITQTYFLAHTARGKLSKEASRADHDLRLLVGHANLLDSLMLELADAEQEQERWFNNTVSGASKEEVSEPKHIQWADTVIEEPEEDWEASDTESTDDESDYDEDEDITMTASSIRRSPSPAAKITTREISDDEDEDFEEDDEEDYNDLALTRTSSRHPPELTSDSEEDSDSEDSMPPSPPQPTLAFSEKQRAAIATTSFYDNKTESTLSEQEQTDFFEDGYYLPQRQHNSLAMIAAY
jgi:hypothetical protein